MKIRIYRDKTPRIAATAFVDATAVVIGDVTIGAHSSLWPMAVARGDVNAIVIGDYTNVQDGTVVHTTSDSRYSPGGYTVTIGNHVTVGHRAVIHGCRIEDYCLIGMSATVMDGAVLEAGLILGAGSLVPSGQSASRRVSLDREPRAQVTSANGGGGELPVGFGCSLCQFERPIPGDAWS